MTSSWWQVEEHWGERRTVDALVVGAGMAGAGVAYWLSRAGMKVAVVDRHMAASGASGRNAGFLTSGSMAQFCRWIDAFGEDVAWELIEGTRENQRMLVREILCHAPGAWYAQRGAVTVAEDELEAERFAATAARLVARGLPLEPIDAKMLGAWGVRGYARGWFFPEDATVHPVHMVRAILAHSGARVWPDTAVLRIQSHPHGVEAWTSRGRISAGLAVLAINGMGTGLHCWLDGVLIPTRGQALVTRPFHAPATPAVYATRRMAYWRPTVDGRLVMGGCRNVDEAGERTSVDALHPAIQSALDDVMRECVPAAFDAGVELRWSGIMAYTPDNLPLVGRVPGEENIYTSAGFCGYGSGWTFRAGKLLVNHLTQRHSMGLLDPARFAEARPM